MKNAALALRDINSPLELQQACQLFMTYFINLYKSIPTAHLGLNNIEGHLNKIWSATLASIEQGELYIWGAYSQEQLVAVVTFNLLEANIILLRTLPIQPMDEDKVYEIRTTLLNAIHQRYPDRDTIVLLIRKANESYRLFCEKAGFIEDPSSFNHPYIHQNYNRQWYVAFALRKPW